MRFLVNFKPEIFEGCSKHKGSKVSLSQEGIGDVLGATVVPMGRVQILVKSRIGKSAPVT